MLVLGKGGLYGHGPYDTIGPFANDILDLVAIADVEASKTIVGSSHRLRSKQ